MSTWVAVAMICTSPLSIDCHYVSYPKAFNDVTECQTEVETFLADLRAKNLYTFGGCHRLEVNITLL